MKNNGDVPISGDEESKVEASYEGRVQADFRDYGLHIEGDGHLEFYGDGGILIHFDIDMESVRVNDDEKHVIATRKEKGLWYLLTGYQRINQDDAQGIMMTGGGAPLFNNRCVSLKVETQTGTFITGSDPLYSFSEKETGGATMQ